QSLELRDRRRAVGGIMTCVRAVRHLREMPSLAPVQPDEIVVPFADDDDGSTSGNFLRHDLANAFDELRVLAFRNPWLRRRGSSACRRRRTTHRPLALAAHFAAAALTIRFERADRVSEIAEL